MAFQPSALARQQPASNAGAEDRYGESRRQGAPSGDGCQVGLARQVRCRLTADEAVDLANQYRADAKVGELATIFGVHRNTVSEVLDPKGITRRERGIPPEFLKEIIASYQSGSLRATIGSALCFDPGTVALMLRRAGVPSGLVQGGRDCHRADGSARPTPRPGLIRIGLAMRDVPGETAPAE